MNKDKIEEVAESSILRRGDPHVVLLGAGASRATFGDAIPLMDDLPKTLGRSWNALKCKASPPPGNFEQQYSWMHKQGGFEVELKHIEQQIYYNFTGFTLPQEPTIYDYLVLGLKPTDVVATFNWDPLLLEAYCRNRHVIDLPDIRFLHGCVSYTTCKDHDVWGRINESCPICETPLQLGEILFPTEEKDYATDPAIRRDWDVVQQKLAKAFHLTIFGYSGPKTDYKAKALLLESWRKTPWHDFAHVEVIDIKPQDELTNAWKDYFPFLHEMYETSFWDSTIARWPRQTEKCKKLASLFGIPSENIVLPRTSSLDELQQWYKQISTDD